MKRLKVKTGGSKSLAYTRWSGGRGYPRRGKRIGGSCCVIITVETRTRRGGM